MHAISTFLRSYVAREIGSLIYKGAASLAVRYALTAALQGVKHLCGF